MGIEAAPPLVTICLALAAMGGLQGAIHWGYYGKPKPIAQGQWDLMLEARDQKLQEEAKLTAKVSPAYLVTSSFRWGGRLLHHGVFRFSSFTHICRVSSGLLRAPISPETRVSYPWAPFQPCVLQNLRPCSSLHQKSETLIRACPALQQASK